MRPTDKIGALLLLTGFGLAMLAIPGLAALPRTSIEGHIMKPFSVAFLVLASCDVVAHTCVQHERDAFDQCMGKPQARANECIAFSKQIFDDCAYEEKLRTCGSEDPATSELELEAAP